MTASGDALEAEIVQTVDAFESVSDHTATWHDAQTMAVLEQRRKIVETLSTRAVAFEVTTETAVETD